MFHAPVTNRFLRALQNSQSVNIDENYDYNADLRELTFKGMPLVVINDNAVCIHTRVLETLNLSELDTLNLLIESIASFYKDSNVYLIDNTNGGKEYDLITIRVVNGNIASREIKPLNNLFSVLFNIKSNLY